jgi:molybdenum cofactor cytidylyltransferase
MIPTIPAGELVDALELGPRELVSIVGGGGKTTTLFALAAALGPPVVMTTTTKMGSDRTEGYPVVLDPTDTQLRAALDEHERVLVWKHRGDHRADGVSPEDCDRWYQDGIADHVVVEADGSRRRPFKAPYPYEPVVPHATSMLLACIGVEALDRPIIDGCHRPDAVVAIVGGSDRDLLTPDKAARVLLSDDGSQRGLPSGARFAVLVHQVDEHHHRVVQQLVAELGDEVMLIAVAPTNGRR